MCIPMAYVEMGAHPQPLTWLAQITLMPLQVLWIVFYREPDFSSVNLALPTVSVFPPQFDRPDCVYPADTESKRSCKLADNRNPFFFFLSRNVNFRGINWTASLNSFEERTGGITRRGWNTQNRQNFHVFACHNI